MKTKTTKGTIMQKLDVNSNKIYPFVKWYVDTSAKDRTKENFDKSCKNSCGCEFENAMENWLIREDVQEAIRTYMKQKRFVKICDVYDAMYIKAIEKGDTNAAKWVVDFSKSEFFEDKQNEMDNYLSGIDIPALKKSGGK
ncbi:hypothetical protein AGR56_13840 [Clostridium sp. DMHC 10]|uniref:hypothetical protein n=1 Tax=Clostridium sp. DMHC 10 TaxID=747377 RepID=UPI00069E7CBD|nr:hypothetical protein [Clostridium sp. DMHC 10]KOF57461.1 hypothetical protein AGR56_13840 [Clostridium sp. DMHC 10]